MTARKPLPKKDDPAGLDKLLLAAGRGVSQFAERAVKARFGLDLNIWDGPDGLGAVLAENLRAAGVPNKRLPELVTPRSVLDFTRGKKKRAVRRKVAR